MPTEFNPRILCPHCRALLEFNHPAGKCLEPSCPHGCALSNEDKAVINIRIMHQYTLYFSLENPFDAC